MFRSTIAVTHRVRLCGFHLNIKDSHMPPVADPRYPIGKFTPPASIAVADRKSAINALEKMPEYLRSALRDLDTIQLNTPYREGGWSIRQVVHHVADSHGIAFY